MLNVNDVKIEDLAGNWKDFDNFVWDRYDEPDADQFAILYLPNTVVADATEHVLANYIAEHNCRSELTTHRHWAVGKITALEVYAVDEHGNPTREGQDLYDIYKSILNKEPYSYEVEVEIDNLRYDALVEAVKWMTTPDLATVVADELLRGGELALDEQLYYAVNEAQATDVAKRIALDAFEDMFDVDIAESLAKVLDVLHAQDFTIGSTGWEVTRDTEALYKKLNNAQGA